MMTSNPPAEDKSLNIFSLPKEVGKVIFEFVGKGSYRYVAGTCKAFKDEYLLVHPGDKQTKPENVVGTVGCSQIYIDEAPEKVKNEGLRPAKAPVKAKNEGLRAVKRIFKRSANHDDSSLDWRSKSHDVAYWAARYGKVEVLHWLKQEGNISLMPQRLHDRRGFGKRVPFDGVGDGGQVRSYYWFVVNGFNITPGDISSTINHASTHGHLPLLKHFHEKGFAMGDRFQFGYAARGGHLEVVRFFREVVGGSKWDNFTCQAAAENGHLDVLKYAHTNGCDWTHQRHAATANKICCSASRGGHVDCLQYYCENGGRPDPYCISLAASGGHLECLVYLLQKGLAIHATKETLVQAIETAQKNGNPGGLEALRGVIHAQLFAEVEELVKYGIRQYLPMTYKEELGHPGSRKAEGRMRSTNRRRSFHWRNSQYPNYPLDRRFSKFPDCIIRGTDAAYEHLKLGIDSSLMESSTDNKVGFCDNRAFCDVKRRVEKDLQLDDSQKREIQEMVDADIERMQMELERLHRMPMLSR